MRVRFNVFNAILLFVTSYYITYQMISVGVPNAIVIPFNIAYALLFPWRIVDIEELPPEGEETDVKTDEPNNK